ncbi:spermatid nuclear transition protein 1 isoform X1 [Erinaceus europaeus]|uniref:Spermatid nuclear transition protein 1 n=1 Tax=Erinaceus europaeus TaxID=9365 RepID=A0ABM3XM72_ERIEU|nr:spermatid nuclear transition protein 1 isoform X1 [Erinaceus europaeus]
MSTTRKFKSHGLRKGKSRAPHKGVKRGSSKRKYRKGSMKSRKRQPQLPLPPMTPSAGSGLVDLTTTTGQQQENRRGTAKET